MYAITAGTIGALALRRFNRTKPSVPSMSDHGPRSEVVPGSARGDAAARGLRR
jgi:hypothetical protein